MMIVKKNISALGHYLKVAHCCSSFQVGIAKRSFTKTNFIHYDFFRVVLDQILEEDLHFGKRPLPIANFRPTLEKSTKLQRVQNHVLNVYVLLFISKSRIDKKSIISKVPMPNKSSLKLRSKNNAEVSKINYLCFGKNCAMLFLPESYNSGASPWDIDLGHWILSRYLFYMSTYFLYGSRINFEEKKNFGLPKHKVRYKTM